MELVKGFSALSGPNLIPHSVVTIGNFDGVHLGHQQILQIAKEKAEQRSGTCIAYTFRPHPQIYLKPDLPVHLLTTYDEKSALLGEYGVDMVIEEPFNRDFSALEPEQFFKDVLMGRLRTEAIVVGYDFAFGRGRHGHLDNLQKFCQEARIELTVVPARQVDEEVVSSSRIRKCLLSGELGYAARLMGRPFCYRGEVVRGDGRGRTLGFPTANLALPAESHKIELPGGVYATRAVIGGKVFPSVTNIGVRPTFLKESKRVIEAHLIDESIQLYGEQIELQFVGRIREERKFSGVDELREQILKDINSARSLISAKYS